MSHQLGAKRLELRALDGLEHIVDMLDLDGGETSLPMNFSPALSAKVDDSGGFKTVETYDHGASVPHWQRDSGFGDEGQAALLKKFEHLLSGLVLGGSDAVIINAKSEIVAGTPKWESKLESSTTLRNQNGLISALSSRSGADLKRAIRDLFEGYGSRQKTVALRSLDGWVTDIVRLSQFENEFIVFAALVLPKQQDDLIRAVESLRVSAGLSNAEVNIALLLAQSQIVDEIALARETSVETVKSQIKKMLAKLGLRRQADLIRLITAAR